MACGASLSDFDGWQESLVAEHLQLRLEVFASHRCSGTCSKGHECAPRCIGWYHSHPSFAAVPSVIDIANQARQQIAHRCVWADVCLRLWHQSKVVELPTPC
jgi:hypothetical protein